MFIDNVFDIDDVCLFDEEIAEYLATHGFPLLSIKGGKFVFRKTKELKKALRKLPKELKNKKKGVETI